jgi:hypothetical protein
VKLDKNGRTTDESVKVIESYPGLPGEDGRWERLISEDGKPVPASELQRQDREREKKARALAERLASEPAREQSRQAEESTKQRQERARAIDDIFVVYDIRMVGRESIAGHDTIAFSLTPRANAQPRTREGGLMRHFTVRAWVSEADHELVRVDAEAIDTMSFGLGLLARVHKGARFWFERRKVNGEVWLPAVASYAGSARVGLVRTLRRSGRSEFSGYKKFAVDTSTTYKAPQTAR